MKSKLEKLTAKEIDLITQKAGKKKIVPLLVSKPTQFSLDEELDSKIKVLSISQGVPAYKFVLNLLREDVDRLWKVYKKAI